MVFHLNIYWVEQNMHISTHNRGGKKKIIPNFPFGCTTETESEREAFPMFLICRQRLSLLYGIVSLCWKHDKRKREKLESIHTPLGTRHFNFQRNNFCAHHPTASSAIKQIAVCIYIIHIPTKYFLLILLL